MYFLSRIHVAQHTPLVFLYKHPSQPIYPQQLFCITPTSSLYSQQCQELHLTQATPKAKPRPRLVIWRIPPKAPSTQPRTRSQTLLSVLVTVLPNSSNMLRDSSSRPDSR